MSDVKVQESAADASGAAEHHGEAIPLPTKGKIVIEGRNAKGELLWREEHDASELFGKING